MGALSRELTGRFDVEGRIGRRGRSETWIARDRVDGRTCVIRIDRTLPSSPRERRYLEGSYAALRRIRHPGLARVVHLGFPRKGGHFLVHEFVRGASMRSLAPHLDYAAIVDILAKALPPLHLLHLHGFVHQCLSPDRIIIDGCSAERVVRVVDTGISPRSDGRRGIGLFCRAPELDGNGPYDGRADIYSLAAVLYEVIVGRPPFPETRRRRSSPTLEYRDVPPIRTSRADCPAALDELVMRMGSHEPGARPRNPFALGKEIEKTGLPIEEVPYLDAETVARSFSHELLAPGNDETDRVTVDAESPPGVSGPGSSSETDIFRWLAALANGPVESRRAKFVAARLGPLRLPPGQIVSGLLPYVALIDGETSFTWPVRRRSGDRPSAPAEIREALDTTKPGWCPDTSSRRRSCAPLRVADSIAAELSESESDRYARTTRMIFLEAVWREAGGDPCAAHDRAIEAAARIEETHPFLARRLKLRAVKALLPGGGTETLDRCRDELLIEFRADGGGDPDPRTRALFESCLASFDYDERPFLPAPAKRKEGGGSSRATAWARYTSPAAARGGPPTSLLLPLPETGLARLELDLSELIRAARWPEIKDIVRFAFRNRRRLRRTPSLAKLLNVVSEAGILVAEYRKAKGLAARAAKILLDHGDVAGASRSFRNLSAIESHLGRVEESSRWQAAAAGALDRTVAPSPSPDSPVAQEFPPEEHRRGDDVVRAGAREEFARLCREVLLEWRENFSRGLEAVALLRLLRKEWFEGAARRIPRDRWLALRSELTRVTKECLEEAGRGEPDPRLVGGVAAERVLWDASPEVAWALDHVEGIVRKLEFREDNVLALRLARAAAARLCVAGDLERCEHLLHLEAAIAARTTSGPAATRPWSAGAFLLEPLCARTRLCVRNLRDRIAALPETGSADFRRSEEDAGFSDPVAAELGRAHWAIATICNEVKEVAWLERAEGGRFVALVAGRGASILSAAGRWPDHPPVSGPARYVEFRRRDGAWCGATFCRDSRGALLVTYSDEEDRSCRQMATRRQVCLGAIAALERERRSSRKKKRRSPAQAKPTPEPSGGGAVVSVRGADLVFRSESMRDVVAEVGMLAKKKVPILLEGESGTGKELLARYAHRASGGPGPFVPVDCPALGGELAASELFGHSKGAYTGAARMEKGLLASASGGSVFLDEVGDLDRGVQAKLLRVLSTGEVRPVGLSRAERVEFYLVSATNVDLDSACHRGAFRPDLLHRLGVKVRVPPLRERMSDVPCLWEHFVSRFTDGRGTYEEDVLDWLLAHDWPGNVRELRNGAQAASAISGGGAITVTDLEKAARAGGRGGGASEETGILPVRLRQGLRVVVEAGGISRGRYARLLGVSARTALRDLKELVGRGCLVRRGSGRGTKYYPVRPVDSKVGDDR